jgi:hypothetical protein
MWMKRISYENEQQEYAYCWIQASEDDLPFGHKAISDRKIRLPKK